MLFLAVSAVSPLVTSCHSNTVLCMYSGGNEGHVPSTFHSAYSPTPTCPQSVHTLQVSSLSHLLRSRLRIHFESIISATLGLSQIPSRVHSSSDRAERLCSLAALTDCKSSCFSLVCYPSPPTVSST